MPIKLKINLASTNTTNGSSSTTKVPSKSDQNAVAGPSTPSTRDSPPIHDTIVVGASDPSAPAPARPKAAIGFPKPKPKAGKKSKVKEKKEVERPTAIPPRLLSSGPSTPKTVPPSSAFETPKSAVETTPIKEETIDDDPDPLSLPISPGAGEISTPTPTPHPIAMETEEKASTPVVQEKSTPKWQRLKKPIKELLNKIMIEIRKRDEYALFADPVDITMFPDYLDIIGGEENMMDMGTMQTKVDEGEYRSMDAIEADLRKLVTAAQTFNPPGSVPHNAAAKILTYGLKHIERFRPIVRTPSPTPERVISEKPTPIRGQSTFSGREGTAPPNTAVEIPPSSYIPVEMLAYPPNSLYAQAVGWSLNGGRNIWTKRQLRGREKFNGKWRHWALDGSRDMYELEDVDDWFGQYQSKKGETSNTVIDWSSTKRAHWWEVDLGGPQGQPPLPFTPCAKPMDKRYRQYRPIDFGKIPDIDRELQAVGIRDKVPDGTFILENSLRPPRTKSRLPKDQAYSNIYDHTFDIHPQDALNELVFGGPRGEAYTRSLNEFVRGAMEIAGDIVDPTEEYQPASSEGSTKIRLDDWVAENYHGKSLTTEPLKTVASTINTLRAMAPKRQAYGQREKQLELVARGEYARRSLAWLTSPERPLDLGSLLNQPSDFMPSGTKGKINLQGGLDFATSEILRISEAIEKEQEQGDKKRKRDDETGNGDSKRIKMENGQTSAGSSPLSQIPDSPEKGEKGEKAEKGEGEGEVEGGKALSREEELTKLRLELISLCKFYPLNALKRFTDEQAERLLPATVRKLLTGKT